MTDQSPKQYEVEIKSLIGGDHELLSRVRTQLEDTVPDLVRHADQKQLNHYFNSDGDLVALGGSLEKYFTKKQTVLYSELITEGQEFSMRSREINAEEVIFVMKVSLGADSHANAVARREFEVTMPVSLDELDQLILSAGFSYKSKWSRERETYTSVEHGITATIDKNAGYGYLVECEKVTDDIARVDEIKQEILTFMQMFGLEEIDQARIDRMFAHYNEHWQDYYGTDKTFLLE